MRKNEKKESEHTSIASLGEFGLIHHLTKNVALRHQSSLKGVGDDAAVIHCGKNSVKVVTTDLLIENIHFDLMYHPLNHLGYKAVIVNLSDIYAMNATPQQITCSIAVSNRFSVEALEQLYEGIMHACDTYDVDLVGGDTSSSNKGLIISITAIGEAHPEDIVYRNTAKHGDMICVTGDLGAAYLGLQMLEREKQVFLENPDIAPTLDDEKYLVGRQLKPEAQRHLKDIFEETGTNPTAMIDISDGLSSDLMHLCTQSNTGCLIYEEHLPIAPESVERALKFNISPVTAALNGGEDYELLFCMSPGDEKKLIKYPGISVIGMMTKPADGFKLADRAGDVHNIKAQGWQHLSS